MSLTGAFSERRPPGWVSRHLRLQGCQVHGRTEYARDRALTQVPSGRLPGVSRWAVADGMGDGLGPEVRVGPLVSLFAGILKHMLDFVMSKQMC